MKKSNKFLKRLYASIFGALEVPILNYHLRKQKGEKHFFDKVESLNKNFGWGTRIVPLKKSISPQVKILPTEEIKEIIKRSRVRAVSRCWCRETFKNCSRPTSTCLVLFFAEDRLDLIKRGFCSKISEDKINHILEEAEKEGLIHQLICCGDEDTFYVICNCCPCCCVGLQALIKYQKPVVKNSPFVAEINHECTGCGKCLKRCYFKARTIRKNKSYVDKEKCLGCGLCVTTCENKSTYLVRREN